MHEPEYDPRFAPIVNPNGSIDMVELGRIEHAHRIDPELVA